MTAPDNASRPEGYYWVRNKSLSPWEVMEWRGGLFWMCGTEIECLPNDLAEIGPRAYPPGEGVEAVTEGWKLVPVEPTEAMLDAHWNATGESREMRQRTHAYAKRYWKAMIDAAPVEPKGSAS